MEKIVAILNEYGWVRDTTSAGSDAPETDELYVPREVNERDDPDEPCVTVNIIRGENVVVFAGPEWVNCSLYDVGVHGNALFEQWLKRSMGGEVLEWAPRKN